MFEPLEPGIEADIEFLFDGQTIPARPGQTIAAALLAAGHLTFRTTPVSASPRSAFCMMGVCFDCLVSIDGTTQQACMTPAAPGLIVTRVPHD